MAHSQLFANPPIRPIWRLPKLVSNQVSFFIDRELPSGKIQRPGQSAFLFFGKTALDNFGAIVAKLAGNLFAIIAVDDSLVFIDQDWHQDAIDGDIVSESLE